jgi:hypothetical protein
MLITGLIATLGAFTAGNVAQDHVFARKEQQGFEQAPEFVIPPPSPIKQD